MLRLRLMAAALVAAIVLSCGAARAGDTASIAILGFSPDGGIFAFEEYGIQDGSGFPYANRYYIDTQSDSFLPGTPVRVRIDDEQATLAAARQEARQEGQEVIADSELDPGFTAGWNAVSELSADPHRLRVNPRPVFPPIDEDVEMRLEERHLEPPQGCEAMGEMKGFTLLRIATQPGGETVTVHEDQSIPSSRGCPLGYRLTGIQTFYPEAGTPVFATIIAIRRFGFEGPDHRFIAVTGPL